jgi:hypothetical protein
VGKKKRAAGGGESSSGFDMRVVLAGIAVLVVAIVAGSIIGTRLLVSADDDDDPILAAVPTFTGDAPPIERSSVADLLASTSFDDMPAEDRERVKAEVNRVYDNADFRITGPALIALDLARRDGTLRALRQYTVSESPGGEAPAVSTTFYCDGPEGAVDTYTLAETFAERTPSYNRIAAGAQPLERLLSATDWSNAKDLGIEEINGRQARGVEIAYVLSDAARYTVRAWFDIENARVLKYVQYDDEGKESPTANYLFDWRQTSHIEAGAELSTPPCYDDLYK